MFYTETLVKSGWINMQKNKMHRDVYDLIMLYKKDLDDTDEVIRLANNRYNYILDTVFTSFDDVVEFLKLLQQDISRCMFITFENRCPRCHDMEIGHYTYIDEVPLTVGVLFEFVRYLKREGRICEHEKVDSLSTSSIISVLKLKWS